MRRLRVITFIFFVTFILTVSPGTRASTAMPSVVQNNCLKCHQNFKKMDNVLAGNLSSKSLKARSIQLKINNRMELVKFTPETTVENIPDLKALSGSVALRVHYEIIGNDRVAKKVVVKPKIKVPENQLINVSQLAQLVAQGPEKGAYTLVDSRPTPGYMKGHIPTAVSIPFPKMKAMKDKLPKDKNELLIFYCQGYR